MDERRQIWRERREHGVREGRGERALPGVPGRRTSGARGAMQAARREALGGAQTPRTCQDATSRRLAQSEAGRGAGEWVGFKVQGVG